MRTLILTRTAPASAASTIAGLQPAMAAYRDELARAGVLLDGAALDIDASPTGGACAGYVLIQTRDPAEAREWARRCPVDAGGEVEVRALIESP